MSETDQEAVETFTQVDFADGIVLLTGKQFEQIKEYLELLSYYIEVDKDRELADLAKFTDELDGHSLEDDE